MKNIFTILFSSCILSSITQAQIPGSPDHTFNPGLYTNGIISEVLKLKDGNYLLAGNFSTYHNYPRNGLVKVKPNLEIDFSFDAGVAKGYTYFNNSIFTALVEQPDGKILVGGAFEQFNGDDNLTNLVRLNADGSLDETFYADFDDEPFYTEISNYLYSVVLQKDGKILVGGSLSTKDGIYSSLLRLNADGSRDFTFDATVTNPTYASVVYKIIVLKTTDILIGGTFSLVNGIERNTIARINTDGSLDEDFEVTGLLSCLDFETDALDNIYLVSNGTPTFYDHYELRKLFDDGGEDLSFPVSTFNDRTTSVTVKAGSIYITGNFTEVNTLEKTHIAKFNYAGVLDEAFDCGVGAQEKEAFGTFPSFLNDALILPGNRIIVVGDFSSFNNVSANNIMMLNASTGTVSTLFVHDYGANGIIRQTAIQADEKILAVGSFGVFNSSVHKGIVRLHPNGTLDTSFNCTIASEDGYYDVRCVQILSDGKILIAGVFDSVNGENISHISKLLPDGSIDETFNPISIPTYSGSIYALTVQDDGKIIIAGNFTEINGIVKKRIARLHEDGSVDASFNPGSGFNSDVYCLALQTDGKILAGGLFSKYKGNICYGVVRLNTDASYDNTFATVSHEDYNIKAISVLSDGNILVGGGFKNAGGFSIFNLEKRNSDGTLDASYAHTGDPYSQITDIELYNDGSALVCGDFTSYQGYSISSLVKLKADGSLDTSFFNNTERYRDQGICDVKILADGKILIAGALREYGSSTKNRIARLFGEPDDICATPENIYADNITSTSVKVHWDLIPDAIKYTVRYRPEGTATWQSKMAMSNIKTLTDLLSNTTYEYRVRTLCDSGPTPYSDIDYFTTLPFKLAEEQQDFLVYPNPNTGSFIIQIPSSATLEMIEIIIYNVSGEVYYQDNILSDVATHQINLSEDISDGVYFVEIKTPSNVIAQRMIVSNN